MGIDYSVDDYTVEDWRKGVTTYDAVLLSNHLNNLYNNQAGLLDGYQKIAADVNRSNVLTPFDVLLIKRMALGVTNSFPSFEAPWRFVPEYIPQLNASAFHSDPFAMHINGSVALYGPDDYADPSWAYQITNINSGRNGYDGIKLGDLNCSFPLANEEEPDPCTEEPVTMVVGGTSFVPAGELVQMRVTVNRLDSVIAFQFGLELDNESFGLEHISGSFEGFNPEDDTYHVLKDNKDRLTVAWFNQGLGRPSSSGDILTLTLRAKKPVNDPSAVLSLLPEDVFNNGFYLVDGCEIDVDIDIEFINDLQQRSQPSNGASAMTRLYCFPNPAQDKLQVNFEATKEEVGAILITDSYGKQIKSLPVNIIKGVNTVELRDLSELPYGTYFVTLVSETLRLTAKVLK